MSLTQAASTLLTAATSAFCELGTFLEQAVVRANRATHASKWRERSMVFPPRESCIILPQTSGVISNETGSALKAFEDGIEPVGAKGWAELSREDCFFGLGTGWGRLSRGVTPDACGVNSQAQ